MKSKAFLQSVVPGHSEKISLREMSGHVNSIKLMGHEIKEIDSVALHEGARNLH